MNRIVHIHQRHKTFTQWWHGLPWDGLFWVSIVLLLCGGAFFSIQGELDYRRYIGIGERTAEVANGETVKVVRILNGDELVIEHQGLRAKVRMLGIRSFDPVVNEREITAYGNATMRFLEQWILERKVQLYFTKPIKDERGRYLSYVQLGDIDINLRMVEEGISMVYTEYETTRESKYLDSEVKPRKTRRGVWGGKKASLRILGLRREWGTSRRDKGQSLVDPLVEEMR